MLDSALAGFVLAIGLIIPIGPQNTFVLRQGLLGQHVFLSCFICALSDSILTVIGVAGTYSIQQSLPWFTVALSIVGGLYLLFYAGVRILSAIKGDYDLLTSAGSSRSSLLKVVLLALSFTWLNPHVYLDVLIIIGSSSTQYPGREVYFGLGAIAAAFVFFYSLGYGARLLRPMFATAIAWRFLDIAVASLVLFIAIKLFLSLVD